MTSLCQDIMIVLSCANTSLWTVEPLFVSFALFKQHIICYTVYKLAYTVCYVWTYLIIFSFRWLGSLPETTLWKISWLWLLSYSNTITFIFMAVFSAVPALASSSLVFSSRYFFWNKKHFKKIGPIRHCEPQHAACFTLPFTKCRYCRTPPAHRCSQQHRQQRQRVTEGTAMAPWNGPNEKSVVYWLHVDVLLATSQTVLLALKEGKQAVTPTSGLVYPWPMTLAVDLGNCPDSLVLRWTIYPRRR